MNDLMSAGLHRVWKDLMINALNPPRGDTPFALLDVAGGTGDIAFRAAKAAGSGFRATVCDINSDMLGVGRARAAARHLDDRVSFVEGNAEALAFGRNAHAATGAGVYAATKAAVEQLVYYLARELGPRQITANSVLPGATRTDAFASRPPWIDELVANTPLRRVGEPSDIADTVAFLVSDEGGWITGQSIAAGGGMF